MVIKRCGNRYTRLNPVCAWYIQNEWKIMLAAVSVIAFACGFVGYLIFEGL